MQFGMPTEERSMAHFSALVVLNEEPTQTSLDDILRPWHDCESAECSERLRDVDITAQITELWNSQVLAIRSANGQFEDPQSMEFYVDAAGRSVWSGDAGPPQRFVLPDGASLVWITRREWNEAQRKDLDDFAEACHAEEKTSDNRYLRRMNPDMKWDWWVLGGNFSGMLIPREKADTRTGEPGANGTTYVDNVDVPFRPDSMPRRDQLFRDRRRSLEVQFGDGVDAVRKSNLNIEAIRERAIALRSDTWSWCAEAASTRRLVDDPVALDRIRANFGRAYAWLNQTRFDQSLIDRLPSVSDQHGVDLRPYGDIFLRSGIYLGPHNIADWIEATPPFVASSIVKDGSWHTVDAGFETQDATETWQRQFWAIFEQIPPDHWLAIVDCHL
jgi:hypothetical protein